MVTAEGDLGPGDCNGCALAPSGRPPHLVGRLAACEVPLTRLTVGMWTSRRHRACQLLLLEEQGQLVVLVDRRASVQRSSSRFLEGLTAASPFASTAYSHAGCVHAFEVPFHSIRGLDYNNPLCLEARLVLETSGLRKREFPTMDAARAYFLEPAAHTHCSPSEVGTSTSTSTGAAGKPPAGQLRTALLSQMSSLVASAVSSEECHCKLQPGSSSDGSRATGSLTLRLDETIAGGTPGFGGVAYAPMPALQAGSSEPVMIEGAAAAAPAQPAAAEAAVADTAGAVTPAGCDSLEFDDDFESEFGSLWYWGSPTRSLSPPSVITQAVEAATAAAAAAIGSPAGAEADELAVIGSSAPSTTGFLLLASSPPVLADRKQVEEPSSIPLPAGTLQRAASEGHLPSTKQRKEQRQQQQQQWQRRRRQADGEAEEWPAAHAFTAVSRVYSYRSICLNWTDPRLPGMLRPIIQGNEQLLKLYESGLPPWAVYAPQYGLFYRPWLRTVTWVLFYAFSVFSFVVGFYDLFKAVPGLQVVMRQLMASMWLPPVAVLEWLEQHTQIRLSILATYLFGKSEAFVWVMRWVHNFARVSRAALQPVMSALGPPLALAGQALRLAGGQAWQALAAVCLTLSAVFRAGLGPIATLLLQCWTAVGAALLPFAQALVEAWSSMMAGAAALSGTARAGRTMGSATSQAVASQAVWLYVLPVDALEVLRTSAVKAAKSAQAVAKFCLHMSSSVVRHRLTLELRAGRAWRRAKERLRVMATVPLLLVAELLKWLTIAARLLVFVDMRLLLEASLQQIDQPTVQEQAEQKVDEMPAGAAGSTLVQQRAAAASIGPGDGVGGIKERLPALDAVAANAVSRPKAE